MSFLKLSTRAFTLTTFTLFITSSTFASFPTEQVHFNHDERVTYQDPYRKIVRKGKNFESIIVKFIDSAQRSVDVAVQDIDLPLVAKALVEAQKRGVKVRFLMENLYNLDLEKLNLQNLSKNLSKSNNPNADVIKDYIEGKSKEQVAFIDTNRDGILQIAEREERDALYILKSNKIKVQDDTSDGSSGSSLMHHKFVVVDDNKVLVTSANFTLSDTHGDFTQPLSVGNNNALLILENPTLTKEFSFEFAILWGSTKTGPGKFGVNKPFRALKSFGTRGDQVSIQFSPTTKKLPFEQSTNGAIIKRIKNAQREIHINLFVFSDQQISNALALKYDQGVEIEVLVDRNFVYRNYSEVMDIFGVAMPDYDSCTYEESNQVWPNANPEIAGTPQLTTFDKNHHKFAVIDDAVLFGSHNWSPVANHANDETFLIIENAALAKEFTREHQRIRRNATMGLTTNLKKSIKYTLDKCKTVGPTTPKSAPSDTLNSGFQNRRL